MSINDHYPRRILLAVAAKSPQIVTETLYVLMQRWQPAYVPTEVHVITTGRGEAYVQQLAGEQGWLAKLMQTYAQPVDLAHALTVHTMTDPQGQVLDDVRTRQDNEYAANFITDTVRHLTADAQSSLMMSLSGGRRTMTFYAGYALSLFGRPQDRLTHVLVEDEYFFQPDFFYPPPHSEWVTRRDGSQFDASQVEVTLADIPFVRLRDGLPLELLEAGHAFSEVVAQAQRRFDPPTVRVDSATQSIHCAGQLISMKPVQLAFYVWLLERCQANLDFVHWSDTEAPSLSEQFLAVYARLFGRGGNYDKAAAALTKGMTQAYFEERKSQVNRLLKKALGEQLAQAYLIQTSGHRPRTRSGVRLPQGALLLH